jgi:nucleotide-binding universal stress UspA family protein
VKRFFAVAAVAVALALPNLSWAAEDPPTDEAAYAAEKRMWQARFRTAREVVATRRARHAEAVEAYKRMRHRHRKRGESKQKIRAELTASEMALEESENALEELYERARRAGVPPGWTRMQRGEPPAAPEPTSDAEEVLP